MCHRRRALALRPCTPALAASWTSPPPLLPRFPSQDMATVIVTAARARPDTPGLVWAWLGRKWRPVSEKLGGGAGGSERRRTGGDWAWGTVAYDTG